MKKKNLKGHIKVRTRLKIGDEVVVISGKNKNLSGEVLAMSTVSDKVLVKGVNFRKKFAPPSQEIPKGGIIKMEAPLHISNVQLLDPKSKKPTRIAYKRDKSGKKMRIAVRSKTEVN